MKSLLLLAFLAAALGCGTTTQIITEPPGASAVLNESKDLGTTPLKVEAQIFAWTRHTVKLSKDGYESTEIVLQSVQPISTKYLALCLCSFATLWPLGLLSDFEKPLYEVVLVPEEFDNKPPQLQPSPYLKFSAR